MMETFGGSGTAVDMEMVLPMEVVAEEVVTQDEVGAEVELNVAGDSLASQTSINMLSKFRKELCDMEDSSEDEGDAVVSSLYLSGQNLADEGNSDVWSGSVKDDCLCWECGERFPSLDQLMSHFRKHEACVRCNLCQVTFRRVVSLSMHLVNVHNNISLFCTACRLPFDSKWDFNKHLGKHSELSVLPVMTAFQSVKTRPREETLVCIEPGSVEKEKEAVVVPDPVPGPRPVPGPMSLPTLGPVPVAPPMSLPVPGSLPVSQPVPVSLPIPRSVPVPVSLPVSQPVPVALSVPVSRSVPESLPASQPVHVSLPLPIPLPGSVPVSIALPVFVSQRLPVSRPVPVSQPIPVPVSVPGPGPVAIPTLSPSSNLNGQGPPEAQTALPGVVAKDHTYDKNRKPCMSNGRVTTAYALRVRHTKTVTKVFPRHSLPKSAHQKKIQLFVFRSVDRSHGKEAVAEVGEGERDRDMKEEVENEEEEEEEEDVKPDMSSLIPPLPDSLDSSSSIKKEGVNLYSKVVPWEGEPIEEDDDLDYLEDVAHDKSIVSGDSDYDPGDVSDASTESISSGNSSGSSYTPNKCWGKGAKTREGLVGRKLSRTRSSQEASDPIRQPDTGEATTFCHSDREPQKPQPSIQTYVQQNTGASSTSALDDHKALSRPFLKPSRMYACDFCREVFPEQVTYRRHHCPLRASAVTTAIASWGTPTSIPMAFTATTTTQKPIVAPNPALMTTISSSLVSASGPITGSNSGVMKVTPMAVPCTIQGNSALVSPMSVASSPSFTLPSIMLPSSTPSVQSGSRPIMATVVFNSPSGRVSRLVLQSQGLTFPTQTLSQTSPIRLSVPTQANTLNPTQASASMQLTNLLLGGLIQPQTLLNSPHLTRPSVPSSVPASAPSLTPASTLAPASAPFSAPIPPSAPVTVPAPISKTAPTHIPASFSISASTLLPASFPVPAQNSSPAAEPLKILGLFVNRSQELALQQRLKKSWRSKGIFLCRQCGAISRQPSLCVRHRYLHRGSRQHRCHCGRTFQRQLHLLRHHVQHAEATRFVCTPCGQTFSGARCLARHKQGQERNRKRKRRVRPRKDCHAPFSCDCGQVFQRPAAFLWHKLKNPKRQGAGL